ncbi:MULTISPECIES: SufE family protein [Halomonadaceae]|uniref:SufE family protein n=1 Tax=Vreelandella halophila TaxID=86177 RepID=A0A9X4Y9K0_9GAMM|nr:MULTISPECIES: SufE family protein [Halomonas]MYL25305.1 SufE family protein [Halomonas utahensis]MYL75222.1 SufE family protein [Halomonas sp. 22501_18_FS]
MTTDTNFTNTELGTDITTDDVRDGFELLDDWEERYGYIMDLGKKLPAFPDDERREANYVHGCQSQVWLIHWKDPESGRLYLLIDSDAMIVRGLAAIIMIALNGRTPDDLLAVDIEGLFEELDLMRHISPTRGNGLRAMVEQIRATAQQYT